MTGQVKGDNISGFGEFGCYDSDLSDDAKLVITKGEGKTETIQGFTLGENPCTFFFNRKGEI